MKKHLLVLVLCLTALTLGFCSEYNKQHARVNAAEAACVERVHLATQSSLGLPKDYNNLNVGKYTVVKLIRPATRNETSLVLVYREVLGRDVSMMVENFPDDGEGPIFFVEKDPTDLSGQRTIVRFKNN